MTGLAVHAWGDPAARRAVCLHGVTGHGRHFMRLAERLLPDFHVLAPTCSATEARRRAAVAHRGSRMDAVLAGLGAERAVWIGHSFGGRVAFEVAANPGWWNGSCCSIRRS